MKPRPPRSFDPTIDVAIVGRRGALEVPPIVVRDLYLVGTPLTALPDGLQVGRDMHVTGRPRLAALPRGLYVGGHLRLDNAPVVELGDDLVVGGDVRLRRATKLRRVALRSVHGTLDLRGASALEELPDALWVARHLLLGGARALTRLPASLTVGGALDLAGCARLAALPADLTVGGLHRAEAGRRPLLDLRGTAALTEIAAPFALGAGWIEVGGSGLRAIPAALAAREWRYRGMRVAPDLVFAARPAVAAVLGVRSEELRRALIEREGIEAFLARARATVIAADTDPGGPRRLVELRLEGRPARFLDCRCPSTGRRYLLRVADSVRTPHAAAAWMAGLTTDDYAPVIET